MPLLLQPLAYSPLTRKTFNTTSNSCFVSQNYTWTTLWSSIMNMHYLWEITLDLYINPFRSKSCDTRIQNYKYSTQETSTPKKLQITNTKMKYKHKNPYFFLNITFTKHLESLQILIYLHLHNERWWQLFLYSWKWEKCYLEARVHV